MRLRVLGSAAAEGWPAMFCSCPGCQKARANGGKDLRRRTAYLLDEDTLIDYLATEMSFSDLAEIYAQSF